VQKENNGKGKQNSPTVNYLLMCSRNFFPQKIKLKSWSNENRKTFKGYFLKKRGGGGGREPSCSIYKIITNRTRSSCHQ
jgi:hypothetical protein